MTQMFCEDCELKCLYGEEGEELELQPMIIGRGPIETARLVLVHLGPSNYDQKAGKLLADSTGRTVAKMISDLGFDEDEIYITSLMKHPIREGKKSYTKKQIAACKKYLDAELEAAVNCKVIVLMGGPVISEFTGNHRVDDQRGRPIYREDGMVLMPVASPRSFIYNEKGQEIFKGDLGQAFSIAHHGAVATDTTVHDIETVQDWRDFLDHVRSCDSVTSFDIETMGLNPHTGEITDFGFSPEPGVGYVVSLHQWDEENERMVKTISQPLEEEIREWFHTSGMQLVTHGGLFDFMYMLAKGWMVYEDVERMWCSDTIYFRHTALDEHPPFKLEFLAGVDTLMRAWDDDKLEYEQKYGKGAVFRMPYELRRRYAAGDVDATIRLFYTYYERAMKVWPEGIKLYHSITHKMVIPMAEALTRGMALDVQRLDTLRAEYKKIRAEAEEEIKEWLGDVNPRSPLQVVPAMEEKLHIQWPEMYLDGKYVKNKWFHTDSATIEKPRPSLKNEVRGVMAMRHPHPIWDALDRFQGTDKLISTYTGDPDSEKPSKGKNNFPNNMCPVTGRIYTNLLPHGTRTRRRSSASPNLQNIPKHRMGAKLRSCFVPTKGFLFGSCDFDQAEIFIAANVSQDPIMLAALSTPGFDGVSDFHRATAAFMFGIAEEDVTPEQRSMAKAVSFGTLYGAGAHRISVSTQTPIDRAKRFVESFYETYQTFKAWQDAQVRQAATLGYVETCYGGRRRLTWPTEYTTRDIEHLKVQRAMVIREAINAPIQGTVADHTARAWPRVRAALAPLGGYIVNEVHDELLTEVPIDLAEECLQVQLKAMTFDVPIIGKPIPVSGELLNRWKEAEV